jgi:hypothetical protein
MGLTLRSVQTIRNWRCCVSMPRLRRSGSTRTVWSSGVKMLFGIDQQKDYRNNVAEVRLD